MAPKVGENLAKAATLLQNAGGDAQAFADFLAGLSPSEQTNVTDLIVNNDNLAAFWARRFPSSGTSLYHEAESTFGFSTTLAENKLAGRKSPEMDLPLPLISGTTLPKNILAGEEGVLKGQANGMKAKRLENGVIVSWDPNDPTAATEVYFPNDKKGQIAGSRQWVNKVEEKWDDKTVEKWRQKLASLGYSVPEEGGWDRDFATTLATAYKQFYADGQKWKQYAPATGGTGTGTDLKVSDLYDPTSARQAVRAKYQQMFGDMPTDKELEEWTGFIEHTATRMARRDKGDTTALSAKFEEKIEQTPTGQAFMEQANELEQQTGLADGILSIASLGAR